MPDRWQPITKTGEFRRIGTTVGAPLAVIIAAPRSQSRVLSCIGSSMGEAPRAEPCTLERIQKTESKATQPETFNHAKLVPVACAAVDLHFSMSRRVIGVIAGLLQC